MAWVRCMANVAGSVCGRHPDDPVHRGEREHLNHDYEPAVVVYLIPPGEASDPVTPNQAHVFTTRMRDAAARADAVVGEASIHHDDSGNLVVTAPITSWSA